MAKTHYYPYHDDDAEFGACGTYLAESSNVSGFWHMVNCKRCLKRRADIENAVRIDEEHIINQMGSMAEFFAKENNSDISHK